MLASSVSDDQIDIRTLIAIVSTIFGAAGVLFGLFSQRWSRRESRLDSLGKILNPYVKSAQMLLRANNLRVKIESLKVAYPNAEAAQEATVRVSKMMDDYHAALKESEGSFREAEAEFATRHFRFPDGISRKIKEVHEVLSELGRLVNEGLSDKADLQLAEFRDKYKRITDTARGWRLADPFEWYRKRFPKPVVPVEKPEFDLTEEEMEGVFELLHKRATTQADNTFTVHPPKILLADPAIASSDNAIERLKDSVFSIVFQDGTAKMLSFPEMMAFVFNLISMTQQHAQISAMITAAAPPVPTTFRVTMGFTMEQIMQPEMVKTLLSKITFSNVASD